VIKVYYAPRTRAVRVVWLLEELSLPYELVRVAFQPPATKFFVQQTPSGKIPTLEDGNVTMSESGAIVEYVLERYGAGKLAPPIGSPQRAEYLQWLHFAESTAFPPLGIVVWLVLYRGNAPDEAKLVADARERAAAGFDYLERNIGARTYLLGDDFCAADIMMGFTLVAAQQLGVLTAERFPRLTAYLVRLLARPALQKTIALG
jgi:glutathione S-transferase